jgi:hypothetical protein
MMRSHVVAVAAVGSEAAADFMAAVCGPVGSTVVAHALPT